MATAAQITANRINALRSTGPVTPEGKLRVAQNAVKHGLTGLHLVVRADEREEFESLRDSLRAEIAPQGALESVAFDELLHAAWNLRRFRRLEAEASLGTLDDFTDPQTTAVLDRLSRYQARAQRAYNQALSQLRMLQTTRALRAEKLNPEFAGEVPALTDVDELTKQTQSDVNERAFEIAAKMLNYEIKTLDHRDKQLRARAKEAERR